MLYLVRHGQTATNAAGLIQGQSDPELTALGREQAAALASALPLDGAAAIVCSPLRRARQTAEAFVPEGADVTVDERWIEMAYGEYEGCAVADVRPTLWERWSVDPNWSPPGGESHASVARRVAEACDELSALAAHQDVIVVTHVNPIKMAVAWALGAEPRIALRTFVQLASVTSIAISPAGHPVLTGFSALPGPGTGGTGG